jgi:hypothetical protein
MNIVPSTFPPVDSHTTALIPATTFSMDSNWQWSNREREAKSIFHLINDVDSSHPDPAPHIDQILKIQLFIISLERSLWLLPFRLKQLCGRFRQTLMIGESPHDIPYLSVIQLDGRKYIIEYNFIQSSNWSFHKVSSIPIGISGEWHLINLKSSKNHRGLWNLLSF